MVHPVPFCSLLKLMDFFIFLSAWIDKSFVSCCSVVASNSQFANQLITKVYYKLGCYPFTREKIRLGFLLKSDCRLVEKLWLLSSHFVSPQRGGSAEHKKLTSLKRIEAKKMVFSVLLLLLTKKCSTFLWLKHPLK